jgi:hypothetical protein
MSRKKIVMFGMVAGSLIGGYAPVLFGAGMLSLGSVVGSMVGGLLGIYIAFRMTA